jgi:spermidine synthase
MMSSPENSEPEKQRLEIEARMILSVVAVGISSTVTQIILLREFLSVFYGNELVIGIILANWMMLTGFGSFLGKYSTYVKYKINLLIILLLLISVLPIITVFSLDILRNIVFPVGTMVGIIQIF